MAWTTGPRPAPCARAAAASDVRPSPRYLLESFVMTPALLVGRHTRIVGWNPLAVAVFGGFPAGTADTREPGLNTATAPTADGRI